MQSTKLFANSVLSWGSGKNYNVLAVSSRHRRYTFSTKGHNSDLRYLRRGRDQLKEGLVSRAVKQAIDGSQILERITQAQDRLDAASRLHESNKRLVDMGQKALREISEASSSISSAQTMEVLDLVTDNKGISVMSSMSNSSASSEIDDAKRAVKAFANALGIIVTLWAHCTTQWQLSLSIWVWTLPV